MTRKIFISHSSSDLSYADQLCNTLEATGISCWIAPRNIDPAQSWGEAIIEGLSECEMVLLLMSEDANKSRHVAREIERADHFEKSVLPIRLDDVEPSNELSYFLGRVQWLDCQRHVFEMHLSSLVEHVQTLVEADLPQDDISQETIWHHFADTSLSIVLGRFLARGSKTPQSIAYGDRKALIELRNLLQKQSISNYSIVYADLTDKQFLSGNLVLIGGTGANKVSKQYVKHVPQGFTFHFKRGGNISLKDTINNTAYISENMKDDEAKSDTGIDYGVVSVAPNPFADDGLVMYLSGNYSYGTWAGMKYLLSDAFADWCADDTQDTLEVLLKVQVDKHKITDYDIIIERPLTLSD